MKRSTLAFALVLAFSLVESIVAIDYVACQDGVCNPTIGNVISTISPSNPAFLLWSYSIPLASTSWVLVGATIVWRRRVPAAFKNAGFDKGTADLMTRMRGARSRLTILKLLQEPMHRNEVSELSGVDWKEVDRQVELLANYGLVSVYAESGAIRLYKTTQQGRLLISLLEKLDEGHIKETSAS